ncbi:type II secretion system protein [bacterium]|nr:type II secretion system protein [bacterium]
MKSLRRTLRALNKEHGFTLMELIIVLLCTSIIMAATIPLFKVQTESYVDAREGKKLMQEARIGFNRLISEMRQITESTEIDWGRSNSIQFDLPYQDNIEYEVDSGSLERINTRLVDGVRSFNLTYYREDGSQISTPFFFSTDVWRIKILLEVGDDDNQVRLESQITPRNFHYN